MAAGNDIRVRITLDNQAFINGLNQATNALRNARVQINASNNNINVIGNRINNVSNNINAAGAQIQNIGSQIINISNQSRSVPPPNGFISGLASASVAAMGVYMALSAIKDIAASIVMPGFELAKTMETMQLGMAGTLKSMTQLNGEALTFQQAMGVSAGIISRLEKEAIRTSATIEDLTTTFRALLAPGLGAGMSIAEIEKFTSVGVNAVKAMGLNSTQFVQELRDLVQGGIQPASSTLATSLQLTDADIKKAKNSTEGLFKFLMDRLQGYKEMSEAFPETMQGKISTLQEVATRASRTITDAFESEIIKVLTDITDLLADVDTKAGEIKFNQDILDFVDNLRTGYYELCAFIDDALPKQGDLWNDLVFIMKDLYHIVIDVSAGFMDFLRVIANSDIMKFFVRGVRLLSNEVAYLSKKFKLFYDNRAKTLGFKTNSAEKMKIQADEANQRRKTARSGTDAINVNELETKYKKENAERIKQAQNALKEMLRYWKIELEKITKMLDRQINVNKLRYDQKKIGTDQYYLVDTQLKIQKQQAQIDTIDKEIEATKNTEFKAEDQSKKFLQIAELEAKREKEVETLDILNQAFTEIVKNAEKHNKVTGVAGLAPANTEGSTWKRENGVNIEGLNSPAMDAISALSQKFYELTGRQMVISSGMRTWGGHVNGNKFDVVDDLDSTLLENNMDGIRDALIEYAESIGLQVLDEYKYPSTDATAGHLDFNATNFTGQIVTAVNDQIAAHTQQYNEMSTELGYQWVQKRESIAKKVLDIMREFNEGVGDISTVQIAQMEVEYKKIIEEMQNEKLPEIAAMAEKIKDRNKLKLETDQSVKNIETAYDDAARKQKENLKTVANDTASVLDTAGQAAEEYLAKIKDERDKLESALKFAKENGIKDLANSIADKLEEINDKIKSFYVVALEKLDTELDRKLALIESNPNLTDMQKSDLSKDVRRKKLQAQLDSKQKERAELLDNKGDVSEVDFEIANTKNQLASLGTVLDDVRQASKQAFEDGLLDFLSRGILECESLKDAFLDLAVSILQSIQKIFAEEMTKDIMISLGFGKAYEKEKQVLDGTGLQGQFGAITANTDQFLTSFEGQMVTFNSKSIAAFQNIIQAIQSASAAIPNNMPSLDFSGSGGSGNSGSGSSFSYDSSWFGTLKAFAGGGSTSQGDNGGLVDGAGTGTSDSIVSLIGNNLVRIANGEYVIKAETVKRLGTRFLDKVNSGEIYNLQIPLPKFAQGGAIGTAGSSAAAKGMEIFSQELGGNVSPRINVNNYVDGQRIFDQYGKPLIRSEARREIMENLKMYTMLGKRF